MKKINWKVRFSNPQFIAQLVMSVLVPILAYANLTVADITTWESLADLLVGAMSNPYCLGLVVVSVYNAIVDNTTPGIGDSDRVLEKNNIKD